MTAVVLGYQYVGFLKCTIIGSTILPRIASGGWVRTFKVETSYTFKLQYNPKGYLFDAAVGNICTPC